MYTKHDKKEKYLNKPHQLHYLSPLLILLLVFVSPASAEVTELNVPSTVVQGDALHISGKALPNEDVWLSSAFGVSLPVSDKKYRCEFNEVYFPKGEKTFSVTAEPTKNLRASIYPVFWKTVDYPLASPQKATNCIATISISFPAIWGLVTIDIYGEKDISVYGDAADNVNSVNLTTEMAINIPADTNGDFTLNISTVCLPIGEFPVAAGGLEKTVEIVSTEPTPTPTPTYRGGGGGGGAPRDTDGDGYTDIEEMLAGTDKDDPCDPNQKRAECLATKPSATPTPALKPAATATQTPITATPISTLKPTSMPTPEEPGFEAVFAIAGLLIVGCLSGRKRKKGVGK